jgi:hypothetical protein
MGNTATSLVGYRQRNTVLAWRMFGVSLYCVVYEMVISTHYRIAVTHGSFTASVAAYHAIAIHVGRKD